MEINFKTPKNVYRTQDVAHGDTIELYEPTTGLPQVVVKVTATRPVWGILNYIFQKLFKRIVVEVTFTELAIKQN